MSTLKRPRSETINVALLKEDHALLKEMAEDEQRHMTRQLSVIIKAAHDLHVEEKESD